ncbi:DUF742 domain-containing protein [Streptomyces sporangiiformans]|uniref:DUF742 domain-containing protein n=1 Tax=Streptomyces sporangiiformans TaxID=2315329 RepID=A0A505DLL1_9ACTN|nr:DUF742 domain-containing protein [Streptomyces sporangiiformans]TPQ20489.1 DUF742 domain-containing protein [Streptomyces sporangiiformans]
MTPPQRRRRLPKEASAKIPQQAPEGVSPHAPKEGGAQGGENQTADQTENQPERLFVLTSQVEDGDRASLDLVTLIVARADAPPTAQPEQSAVLRLCGSPLSVAELSAYLNLPFSVVTALLTELLTAELVHARAPIVRSELPDRSLLEAVMHGLQKL